MTVAIQNAQARATDPSLLWCGGVTLGLGLTTLIGHATHTRLLLEILPRQNVAVVISASACLILCGGGLLLSGGSGSQQRIARALIAAALLVAAATLAEHILGIPLGIDFPDRHAWIAGPSLSPGRMGLDSALGVVAFGVAYFLSRGSPSRLRARVARGLVGFVLVLACLGVLGHVLTIDFVYTWPLVTRLAVPTALGLIALSIGLQRDFRHREWYRAMTVRPLGDQLTLDAEVFLVAVAAAAGLVAFAVMQGRLESLVSLQLAEQLEDRATFFSAMLAQAEERTATIATRPGVGQLYERLATDPNDRATVEALAGIATSFLPHGFSAIQFDDLNGAPIASIGTFRAAPELKVSIRGVDTLELFWDQGYYVRLSKPILWKGMLLGRVATEEPMPRLTRLSANPSSLSESGEVFVCATATTELACFPTRFQPRPFLSGRQVSGQVVPMDRALAGQIGVSKSLDRNRHWVLASYGPVGATGLGMVMKIDLVELYRPIRQGFEVILPLLVLLVAAGSLLLRWRLRPVLKGMADAQRAVIESENRFRIASESGLDAFLILESLRSGEGKVVDFLFSYVNRNAEKMLGQPRARLLNQSVGNAVPTLVKSGWLERYKKVVDTGRPSDAEHSVEFRDIAATWVHQHIVPLGDGVAVTVTDISERKRLEQDLRRMAQADALTQLPNRALFMDRLERAMIRNRGTHDLLAVMAVDIDHFQALNRDHGHASGDAVLKMCASRLAEGIRIEDTVGRIDGDIFGVILEGLSSRSHAFGAAEAMLSRLGADITLAETSLRITASIGITLYAGEKTTAPVLLERAVSALDEVRRRGGNGYFAAEATQGAQTSGS